jgi:hypothetical protein
MYTFIRFLVIQELGKSGILNEFREYRVEVGKKILRPGVLGSCPFDGLCY